MEEIILDLPRRERKPYIDERVLELEEEVKELQEERNKKSYDWVEKCNTNIWEFRDQHPALMRSLEDELDITQWDEVAADLGLTYQQIERCRKCHRGSFTREVFSTMEGFPRYQHMTLKMFLQILIQHKREDILLKLEEYARLGIEPCTTAKTFTFSIRETEVLLASEVLVPSPSIEGEKSPFRAKVLLIHANDTKEDALQVACWLRQQVGSRRLTVLLLQESDNVAVRNSLRSDPWNSIHKWFSKVDAVVPILSPLFLRQIQNRDSGTGTGWEKRYNRYVYSMMLDQYVEQGCKNYSCRAVCPAKFQREVSYNEVIKHSGLFRVNWNCSSSEEIQECAKILYEGAKEIRLLKKKWKKEQKQQLECENNMTCTESIYKDQ